ncbi:MAG: glycerate kinase [Acutalibacteraceae bacterium]
MKIISASDSFKGSLSSKQIAEIIKQTAKEVSPDIEVIACPIADGGEGTLDVILQSGGFSEVVIEVCNPLFEPINARYAASGKTAFIEMAQASGLTLIPYKDGNAAFTTTFGTGQLIADAIQKGAEEIYVAVGGSATNDGGIGALCALGGRFFDKNGRALKPIGENLEKIEKIDFPDSVWRRNVKLTVLADVENPLVGETGATRFYGKQKGAVGEVADRLENGMIHFADIVQRDFGKRLHELPFAGAAGGLAGGLMAFLNASPASGIETVLKLIGFEEKLSGADAVITGEGKLDKQSLCGKAISGVCAPAKKLGVPVYAIVGSTEISQQELSQFGIKKVETLISDSKSLQDAIENASVHMQHVAKKLLIDIVNNAV